MDYGSYMYRVTPLNIINKVLVWAFTHGFSCIIAQSFGKSGTRCVQSHAMTLLLRTSIIMQEVYCAKLNHDYSQLEWFIFRNTNNHFCLSRHGWNIGLSKIKTRYSFNVFLLLIWFIWPMLLSLCLPGIPMHALKQILYDHLYQHSLSKRFSN